MSRNAFPRPPRGSAKGRSREWRRRRGRTTPHRAAASARPSLLGCRRGPRPLIPFPVLGLIIILCSIIGAYSIRFLLFDVWVTLVFGVIGYLMRKLGFPMAPMVLATVLAPMLEVSLQQSLLLSLGSPFIFFHRPLAAFFIALAL